jgi:HEAT repeat protein
MSSRKSPTAPLNRPNAMPKTSRAAFNRKLAAVDALRSQPVSRTSTDALRQALGDRNSYLVARAATVCADLRQDGLIPELLLAFERFFVDPVKSDPQCLAKHAIARALRDLSHHGAEAYQRGIVHVQLEPTWGGRADTAAALRGTCALGLSECPIDDFEILTYLTDALADADQAVRVDAALALEQLNRPEGALLLRLKLLVGDPAPAVLGQCFSSMLSLAPETAVSFVSRFLNSPSEDVQIEAASSLAQCRDPQAMRILREYWQNPLLSKDLRQALLINLGASPVPDAAEFLLEVVSLEVIALAQTALKALSTSRFHTEIRPRLATALDARDSYELNTNFAELFVAP